MSDLLRAWTWRENLGIFRNSQVIRVFHGPGEGKGLFQNLAVDRFVDHYWVTEWESERSVLQDQNFLKQVIDFYRERGAKSVVGLNRPTKGVAPESTVLFGAPPTGRFEVQEGPCRFYIQLEKTRHPGLFLDHEPLRNWLFKSSKGLKVLNTFAYTGSLSVAAALGGAESVTTLDLSQATLQWAKQNFALNQLEEGPYSFIGGDYFDVLPRLKRKGEKFDCIILDPPSFSHGKTGKFSTAKDLERLHGVALDLLSEEGILITSINSANISWKKYEDEILSSARKKQVNWIVLQELGQPCTFPTFLGQDSARYLKGFILKKC